MSKIALHATTLALAVTGIVAWAARPASNSASDLLQFLPDGAGVVVIDFQKITSSSLWSSGHKGIKDTIEKIQPGIPDLVNPADIHRMAVAIQGFDFNSVVGVATGNFNQAEVLARLKADQRVKLSPERYKNVDVYSVSSTAASGPKRDVAFAFYDVGTIIVGKAAGVRTALDARLGEKDSIAQNARLTGALAEVPSSAIRFALVPTPAMTGGLQSSELPIPDFSTISLIFGNIDLASSLDLNATLRSDTGEHARSIAERLNGLLAMARGYLGAASDPKMTSFLEALKTVNISSADADVKITGSVPMELLNSLLGNAARKA